MQNGIYIGYEINIEIRYKKAMLYNRYKKLLNLFVYL
jgi:hypothetical protein